MAAKKTASKKTARKEKAPTPKPAPEGIGVKEVAAAAGVSPAYLRKYLRSTGGVKGHEPKAQYQFSSLTSPEVRKILTGIKEWDAENKAKAKANGGGKAKKSKGTKHQRQTEELKAIAAAQDNGNGEDDPEEEEED